MLGQQLAAPRVQTRLDGRQHRVRATAGGGAVGGEALAPVPRRHRVRRLIVLDDAGRVVGLAALEDLLEAMTREFGELVMALRGAREREIKERQ